MFCVKCGAELDATCKFCHVCGYKVAKKKDITVESVPDSEKSVEQPVNVDPESAANTGTVLLRDKNSRFKEIAKMMFGRPWKIFLWLFAVVIIVAGIVVLPQILNNESEKDSEPEKRILTTAAPTPTNVISTVSEAENSFEYRLMEDNTICITGLKDKSLTTLIIPEKILDTTVTCIDEYAFAECTDVIDISIPDSVTNIGDCAFCWCESLLGINLPKHITNIGECAFYGCIGLTSICIPDGVMSIKSQTFSGCNNLVEIRIPESVSDIENYVFEGCDNLKCINVFKESYAAQWAKNNGYSVLYEDGSIEVAEPINTPSPTFFPELTNTPKLTDVPSPTEEPSNTPTPTNTSKPTNTPKPTKKPTPTSKPKATNTPKPTNTPTPKISSGDVIEFGSYIQEAEIPTPIKWIVLEVKDGKALLLSQDILECRPYNDKYEKITWEKSSLRKWLNGDFLKSAFSSTEKGRILPTHNENPDNQFGTKGGKATDDYIFCLSLDEAEKLWKNERTAKVTQFAERNGCYLINDGSAKGNGWWWLRTLGFDSTLAVSVDVNGDIYSSGSNVNYYGYTSSYDSYANDVICVGVRPALWLRIN